MAGKQAMICRNCETTLDNTDSELCVLCHLAVAGASLAGKTEEQALAMVRTMRTDPDMQPFTQTFEHAVRDVYGSNKP